MGQSDINQFFLSKFNNPMGLQDKGLLSVNGKSFKKDDLYENLFQCEWISSLWVLTEIQQIKIYENCSKLGRKRKLAELMVVQFCYKILLLGKMVISRKINCR